ncbi:hypothetical protein [Photobacterium leiognathi]|uniref:hypothetical protein n=1 Tax=Photobacterium leiognathi TaxID=553611 RepID=UPI002982153A|nr:hypothetical protein [Photobacterium leiognathi]
MKKIKHNNTQHELNNITLKLHHNEMRDCPEEVLLALYRYTSGYHKIAKLIGEQIEPNVNCTFKLEHVQRGSIELKNKIGYKPSSINFIAYLITKLLKDDTSDNNLDKVVNDLEKETTEYNVQNSSNDELFENNETYIDKLSLAEALDDFSKASELLEKAEYFEIYNEENGLKNNYKINPHYKSTVSIKELKKSKPIPFDDKDTLIALRPCNVGQGRWYVYSVITKRSFYTSISDYKWLSEYQSGKMDVVRANDIIHVNLQCNIVKYGNKTLKNINSVITKVHNIERSTFMTEDDQVNLF